MEDIVFFHHLRVKEICKRMLWLALMKSHWSRCVGESWPYLIIPGLMSLSDMRTARLDSWMLTEKAWMVIKLLGHQRNIKAIEPYLSQSFRSLKKRAYLDLPPYSNTIIITIDRSYIISNVMILFTEQATHEWLVVTSSKVTTNHVMWCSCERMSTALNNFRNFDVFL